MNRKAAVVVIVLVSVAVTVPFLLSDGVPDSRPLPGSCDAPVSEPEIEGPTGDLPPTLAFDVVPQTRQIEPNQTAVFLVCVANPRENNRTVNPILTFWHSGSSRNAIHVVGRDVASIPTGDHVGILPLDVRFDDGRGRYVAGEPLDPGEVTQYTIVASNLSETGQYVIRAKAGEYRYFGTNEIELNVVCSPSCTIAAAIGTVERFLAEYGTFIVAVLGTAFTILAVLIQLYGRKRTLTALGIADESGTSEES